MQEEGEEETSEEKGAAEETAYPSPALLSAHLGDGTGP